MYPVDPDDMLIATPVPFDPANKPLIFQDFFIAAGRLNLILLSYSQFFEVHSNFLR
jgi:hypothetical protein